jgi:uncharacterized protein YecE (DUF72 family)
MDTEIRVGPAGWSYDDWKGAVYPPGADSKFDPLAYLKDYFDTIEINSTFYHPQRPTVVEKWVRRIETNSRFLFTVKLWRHFTHDAKTLDEEAVGSVRAMLEPLRKADRLGAVLCQFPWSFRGNRENSRYLRDLFATFSDYPLALEVRHASWGTPEVFDWLREQRVAFCNIDQPVIGASLEKTEEATAPIGYFRLHGQNIDNWFNEEADVVDRYDYLYDAGELEPWAAAIEKLAPQLSRIFIIFNNHYQGQAPANALEFLARLSGGKVAIPPPLQQAYPRLNAISTD